MALTRKQLQEIMDSLPPDVDSVSGEDAPAEAPAQKGTGEATQEEGDTKGTGNPNPESAPSETQMTQTNPEETKVLAPEVPKDVTISTPDQMVAESLDMRLAHFQKEIDALKDTTKILLDEVKRVKAAIDTFDKAIDTAAEMSPTCATIESLINQL